jgi:hypothetical protein
MSRPELLDRALAAHGGLERWEQATEVRATVHGSGLLFLARGQRDPGGSFVARAHEPHVVAERFDRPGWRGISTPDRVRIETLDGALVDERADPRAAFRHSLRRQLRWDDLDLLYFAGYAMWNYLTAPFLLARPGVQTRQLDDHRLAVMFPFGIPTHSREQVFHFGDDGLLQRLDYTADVVGPYAKAAHLCFDHAVVDGITMPTRRRVVPRGPRGRPLRGPALVALELSELAVH